MATYRIMKHVYKSLNCHINELCAKEKLHIFDDIMFKLWNHCAKKLEKKNILTFDHNAQAHLLDLCSMHNHPERHFKHLEIQVSEISSKVASTELHLKQLKTQLSELNYKSSTTEPLLKQLEAQISELKSKVAPAPNPTSAPAPRRKYKKIICVQGYGWSGSSALNGFFSEFSNTSTFGLLDNIYSKGKIKESNTECPFFWQSPFIPFINSFACASAVEKDWQIKRFIKSIYNCYDSKGSCWYEKNPAIYTSEFLNLALKFLYSVIELDDYTIQFMKDKRFPVTWNSSDETFNKCCFMKEKRNKAISFLQV